MMGSGYCFSVSRTRHITTFTRRFCVIALIVAALAGCSKASATKHKDGYETLKLRYQGYPTLVGWPELAQDLGYLAPLTLEYLGSTISGPQNIQAVATGDIEFGGAFNGAVVKLVAAKAPIKAVVAYYGTNAEEFAGFYVLPDSPIKSGRDLIGKKIAVNTVGAHSEFTIREYLSRQGLSDDEVKQVQLVVLPPGNGEQALREKQVDVAAMQTILYEKALERGPLRLLFSDHQLFGDFNAGSLVMRTQFIEENPNTVRKFVEASAKAIEWARSHPREEVIARLERVMKKRSGTEDVSQLKYWKSTTVASKQGRLSDADFQVWVDWLTRTGQLKRGQLKPADLYTNAFQQSPEK
jgi:ABC-type nitrate/sulfonate/bicarbonate transport system substrate-binding protein